MSTDDELIAALREVGRASVPPAAAADAARRDEIIDAMVDAALSTYQPQSERLSVSSAGRLTSSELRPAELSPARPTRPLSRGRWLALSAAAALLLGAAGVVFAVRSAPQTPPAMASATPQSEPRAFVHAQAGGVVVIGAGGVSTAPTPGAGGRALAAGDRVATLADGRATLHLGSVAVVALSPNSELQVGEGAGAACEMRAGSAHFEVAKLVESAAFSVRTPDALVTVHGTSFRVTVEPQSLAQGPRTQVAVTEGVVSVQAVAGDEVVLHQGERWPAPASSASEPEQAPAQVAEAKGAQKATSQPTTKPSSELAAQNALLTDALAARRRGESGAEAKALDSFIARYPNSPGAHDAIVRRMRVAARAGDTAAAVREAQRYLKAFPDGPLRGEAQAILGRARP